MCAAEHGQKEIVKILLKRPNIDASLTDCVSFFIFFLILVFRIFISFLGQSDGIVHRGGEPASGHRGADLRLSELQPAGE